MRACVHTCVHKKIGNTKKKAELYQMNYACPDTSVENVRNRPKQFLSVTSLFVEEFDYLLSSFSSKWRNYYRIHTIEGKKRKAPIFNPEKTLKHFQLLKKNYFSY